MNKYVQAKTEKYDCERLLKGVRVENRRLRKELEGYKKAADRTDLPEKICLDCGQSHDNVHCPAPLLNDDPLKKWLLI